MNDLIGIVIPVYNSELYLDDCFNSVLDQTYKNYEIIVINDGSNDNSLKIIKKYAKKHENIKYISSKKNNGAATARNIGIDLVLKNKKIKYICFVDSDDYIDKNYLLNLYKIISENNCDISCCLRDYTDDLKVGNNTVTLYSKDELVTNYLKGKVYTEAPCDKLFKIDLFRKIRFPDGMYFEDSFISYKIIESSKVISQIDYYGYHIRRRKNSLCRGDYSDKQYDRVIANKEIFEYYENTCFSKLAYNKYLGVLFYFIIRTNSNRKNISKNRIAIEDAKRIVTKNGFKNAKIKFYPFITATYLNLLKFIKYQ